jgi:tRNA(Ile)-lysidine synthase
VIECIDLAHNLENYAHVYIGLSGGVDSVVLLDVIFREFYKNKGDLTKLTAIYINHQLQPQSEQWALFCQNICNQYQINFICEKVNASPKAGESIENFARTQRYALFCKHIRPERDILVLAHHQDDQAETVLFRLIKGAGPKGLSGMAKLVHYQNRLIYRPLLSTSKQAIVNYASKNKLNFIQDPSNEVQDFDRNYLRQTILPALSTRFGAVNQAIVRSAKHYRQQQQALDFFIEKELAKIESEHISKYRCLDFKLFNAYPEYIQKNLLRKWFDLHHYQAPSEKKLSQILHQLSTAKNDKIPKISWGEENQYILRKYDHKIFINLYQKESIKNVDFDADFMINNTIQKKSRMPGQKIYFLSKTHSVVLKKFLQTLHIPPWDRNQVSLYFYQEKYLVAVEGYWIDKAWIEKSKAPL